MKRLPAVMDYLRPMGKSILNIKKKAYARYKK
jgi:hypothetical protein